MKFHNEEIGSIKGSVKCNLPKTATAEEKLEDVVAQLRVKYQNKKIYALWQIEKENREIKASTISQWSKKVSGLPLREYLLSIGILSPTVSFGAQEELVELNEIQGKKCCAVDVNGERDKTVEALLKKIGAKIVSADSKQIDYLYLPNPSLILKEPMDRNDVAYKLLNMRDEGQHHFRIVSRAFVSKAEEYIKNMQEERSKQNKLPDITELSELMHLASNEEGHTTCFEIGGKSVPLINLIDYETKAKKYSQNVIPTFDIGLAYVDLKELFAEIKEMMDIDDSIPRYPSNYKKLHLIPSMNAKAKYDQFVRICYLCKYEGVLKLISHAVPCNKDGSIRKRAVTPIAYTGYMPFDMNASEFRPQIDFIYHVLVAKNTDNGIQLEIRSTELIKQYGEEELRTVPLPSVSEELVDKILALGELVMPVDTDFSL